MKHSSETYFNMASHIKVDVMYTEHTGCPNIHILQFSSRCALSIRLVDRASPCMSRTSRKTPLAQVATSICSKRHTGCRGRSIYINIWSPSHCKTIGSFWGLLPSYLDSCWLQTGGSIAVQAKPNRCRQAAADADYKSTCTATLS